MPLLLFQRKEAKIICNIDKVKFTTLLIQFLIFQSFQFQFFKVEPPKKHFQSSKPM